MEEWAWQEHPRALSYRAQPPQPASHPRLNHFQAQKTSNKSRAVSVHPFAPSAAALVTSASETRLDCSLHHHHPRASAGSVTCHCYIAVPSHHRTIALLNSLTIHIGDT
ncbi:hypothetical protein EJ04DRAFT_83237 [Polyplosphaeria fusca]|uniref:Uncharacterized protein n=1 Tax=Polyplosphaeria fusca TaxID=682080 RepID=A0A9P4QKI6_9PLEO|nr:hypothetical protein EJ04DRAFT_83237 [Polyplosphaeria fusca]